MNMHRKTGVRSPREQITHAIRQLSLHEDHSHDPLATELRGLLNVHSDEEIGKMVREATEDARRRRQLLKKGDEIRVIQYGKGTIHSFLEEGEAVRVKMEDGEIRRVSLEDVIATDH